MGPKCFWLTVTFGCFEVGWGLKSLTSDHFLIFWYVQTVPANLHNYFKMRHKVARIKNEICVTHLTYTHRYTHESINRQKITVGIGNWRHTSCIFFVSFVLFSQIVSLFTHNKREVVFIHFCVSFCFVSLCISAKSNSYH